MPETESSPEEIQAQLESRRKELEEHRDILSKVDNGVDPEDLAKEFDSTTLSKVLDTLAILISSEDTAEKLQSVKRYRVLQMARIKHLAKER